MRLNYARLEGKTVIPSDDVMDMVMAYKGDRAVATSHVGHHAILTLFMAHNVSHGPRPLWFVTRVTGEKYRSFVQHYETYDEALEGHERAVKMVKAEEG